MATYPFQVASGSATASGDLGMAAAGVRNDALAQLNPTNLAYGFYSVDASGRIYVTGNLGITGAITASCNVFQVSSGSATGASDLGIVAYGVTITGDISDRVPTTAANLTYQRATYDASGRVFTVGAVRSSATYGHGVTHGLMFYAVATTTDRSLGDSRMYPLFSDLAGNLRVVTTGTIGVSASAVTASAVCYQNGTVWGVSASAVTAAISSGTMTLASGSIAAITATAGTPAGVTVSTATGAGTVQIVGSNTARKAILITNNGAGSLFLGHTTAVTTGGATMGLLLPSLSSYSDSGWGLYTGALFGVYTVSAATQNVSVSDRS